MASRITMRVSWCIKRNTADHHNFPQAKKEEKRIKRKGENQRTKAPKINIKASLELI